MLVGCAREYEFEEMTAPKELGHRHPNNLVVQKVR
jgi:hypothetical protein